MESSLKTFDDKPLKGAHKTYTRPFVARFDIPESEKAGHMACLPDYQSLFKNNDAF